MCLVKSEDKPRIAAEPILIYKVLKYHNDKYYSPFEDYEYRQGLNTPDMTAKYYNGSDEEITGGYLHAYVDGAIAIANRNSLHYAAYNQSLCDRYNQQAAIYKVVKMYIPEGTEYWLGTNEDIAAKELYWPEENDGQ